MTKVLTLSFIKNLIHKMRNTINLLFALLLLTSCSVEKVNLSPLSNSFSSYSTQTSFSEQTYKSMERVNYLSEITNTLTEFPVFKNQKLNAEIYKMKLHISDYIYSIKQNNKAEQTKAYKITPILIKRFRR